MGNKTNKRKFTHQFLKGLLKKAKNGGLNLQGQSRKTFWDEGVNRLGVRVYSTGRVTFFMRYRINGKQRRISFGKFPDLSLKDAREQVREINSKIAKGIDPVLEEKRNHHRTFKDLADEFWEEHATQKLAASTQKKYRRIIDNMLLPEFGDMDPVNITERHVKDLMRKVVEKTRADNRSQVEESKKGHCRANSTKNVLSSIFSHTDFDLPNPCDRVEKLERAGPRKNPLDEDQIKTLWEVLDTENFRTACLFRMFLLLGQRRGETSRMKWEHIENDIWTIPAGETKSNRMHKVPIPSLARDILDELHEETGEYEWVFKSPTKRNDKHINSYSRSVIRIREKAGFSKDQFRIHDLRSTVRTYLSKLGVRKEIADRIQNHAIGGVSDTHYDAYYYIPEKREALEEGPENRRIGGAGGESFKPEDSRGTQERSPAVERRTFQSQPGRRSTTKTRIKPKNDRGSA